MARVRTRRTSKRYRPATKSVRAAVRHGRRQASAIIERRPPRRAERKEAVSSGLLIAEGDSWFDYPFHDVLEELEQEYNYDVESVAHKGDTLEEMAYDTSQLSKLASKFQKLGQQGRQPRAILLSGGGNDMAGDELGVLLNHKSSGLTPLNDRIVAGVLEDRLAFAIISLISSVTELSRRYFNRVVPVLMHGYDYPVPDGRGYSGGFWILPGPWLEPGFRQKGYSDMTERCRIMVDLMDRFNTVLAGIAGRAEMRQLTYVDLRGTLSNDLAGNKYRRSWGNELHPTEDGFLAVAGKLNDAIRPLPMP